MARQRKDTPTPTLEDMAQPDSEAIFYARLAQLERAIGILSAYIAERDQLRYIGADADIVGISRQFRQ